VVAGIAFRCQYYGITCEEPVMNPANLETIDLLFTVALESTLEEWNSAADDEAYQDL